MANQAITLQRLNGTTWQDLQTVNTVSGGGYSFPVTSSVPTVYNFRTTYAGYQIFYSPATSTMKTTVVGSTTYTLTLTVQGQGFVDVAVGTHTYDAGTVVTINILSGVLSYWTLDGTQKTTTPISITMGQNHVVAVVFTTPPNNKKLTVQIEGEGTINLAPGDYTYPAGTIVTPTVTSGTVEYWTVDGGAKQTGLITVTMNADHLLLVHFSSPSISLNMPQLFLGFTFLGGGSYLAYDDHKTLPTTTKRKTER
jgi:hypothetical protein